MANEVIIGKYAIESLTTGMYADPFVIYREYIQNAADAIDEAIRQKMITAQEAKITISLDPVKNQITIEDNGTGLPIDSAYRFLSDIGNSRKKQGTTRGFRGIGRFSGLSYCDKLSFVTTSRGENKAFAISFDAKGLREIMSEDVNSITANEAMVNVIKERTYAIASESHFFRVILENVHIDTGLLDIRKVEEYLCEVAPVGYGKNFSWGAMIEERIKQELGKLSAYTVLLETPAGRKSITKPYTDIVLLNRQTGVTDSISDIVFTTIQNKHGKTIGVVWYGVSSFIGTIIGKEVKCLRLRSGNILIGDYTSLNSAFKDSRFNGWIIGEVIVNDHELIPNARRDGFEHNDAYYYLFEQLKVCASTITKSIRNASVQRNKLLSSAVDQADEVEQQAELLIDSDKVTASKKGQVTEKLNSARRLLNGLETNDVVDDVRQSIIDKLDVLIGRINCTTSFKAINVLDNLNKNEKQLLERIFTGLLRDNPEDEAGRCIDMILAVFANQASTNHKDDISKP